MSEQVDDNGAAEALLRAEELVVGYRGRGLLPPLTFTVSRGEFVAVVGRNGSGKSTLFKTLLGLQPPIRGRVARSAGVHLSFVPQRQRLDPLLPLRVREFVAWGAVRGWQFWGPSSQARRRAVDQALAHADAESLADRPFNELSEGERQRVVFARLLVGAPDVAFLDEPTAAMDAVAEHSVMADLRHLAEAHGVAVVVVSHFVDLAADLADQLIFLDPDGGHAVCGASETVMASEAFRNRYIRRSPIPASTAEESLR